MCRRYLLFDQKPQISAPQVATEALLWHQSLNQGLDATILFIHGAFSDSNDWDLVVPYMRDYHLLLADCPGHGQSSNIPFSIEASAKHIAYLIEAKASSGRAHVVGHSLGASIAICLAVNYPHVVRSMFVSGYSEMRSPGAPLLPYLFWTMNYLESAIPRPFVRWLMDGADLRRTPGSSLSLCREIARTVNATPRLEPWPARTLIIVAGKGGLVPSNDNPEAARKLVKIGKEGNIQTVAYNHPSMRLPWNRQDPFFWATTVIAWVEGKDLPTGFMLL